MKSAIKHAQPPAPCELYPFVFFCLQNLSNK
jgi:hypothetical protein